MPSQHPPLSKTRRRVLAALSHVQARHTTAIATRSGVGRIRTIQQLNRLEKEGVVTRDELELWRLA